jgi:hypothetical protein
MGGLKTKWIDLLKFMYKKDRPVSFKDQNIYKSNLFYQVMKSFVKAGWVKCRKQKINNLMYRNVFSLTMEGIFVIELVFSHL